MRHSARFDWCIYTGILRAQLDEWKQFELFFYDKFLFRTQIGEYLSYNFFYLQDNTNTLFLSVHAFLGLNML